MQIRNQLLRLLPLNLLPQKSLFLNLLLTKLQPLKVLLKSQLFLNKIYNKLRLLSKKSMKKNKLSKKLWSLPPKFNNNSLKPLLKKPKLQENRFMTSHKINKHQKLYKKINKVNNNKLVKPPKKLLTKKQMLKLNWPPQLKKFKNKRVPKMLPPIMKKLIMKNWFKLLSIKKKWKRKPIYIKKLMKLRLIPMKLMELKILDNWLWVKDLHNYCKKKVESKMITLILKKK